MGLRLAFKMPALAVFRSLRNPVFAQLYSAQAISLLGDALSWVALALLAFELAGEGAGVVLGVAPGQVQANQEKHLPQTELWQ